MSTTISVTDPNFSVSPYTWASITVGGSTPAIRSVYSSAFINPSFTGTSAVLNVDTSSLSGDYAVQSFCSIDGGAYTQLPNIVPGTTSMTLATGLSNGTHTLSLFVCGLFDVSGNGDLWPGNLSLTVTGITLDTGGSLIAAPSKASLLEYGDSTMMGYTGSQVIGYASFGTMLGVNLGMSSGDCAFSGQGWTTGVAGTSPGLVAGWQGIYNGQSRTFSPTPQILINNMGENQTVVAATVTTWLGSVRAVLPNVYINQIMPFNQTPSNVATNVTQIKLGFSNYISANPSENRMNVIDLGSGGQTIVNNSTYSQDGIHPNIAGCALFASIVAPMIVGAAQAGNSPSLSPRIGRF